MRGLHVLAISTHHQESHPKKYHAAITGVHEDKKEAAGDQQQPDQRMIRRGGPSERNDMVIVLTAWAQVHEYTAVRQS